MKRSDDFFDEDDKKYSIDHDPSTEEKSTDRKNELLRDQKNGRKSGRKSGPGGLPSDFPDDFPGDFSGGFPGGWHGGPPKMPLKERVILWIAVIFWVVLIVGVVVCGPIYRKIKKNNVDPKPSSGNQVTVTPASKPYPEKETDENASKFSFESETDENGLEIASETESEDDFFAEIEQYFPDEQFRQYVSTEFDTDHDGILTSKEIKKVEVIEVENRDIRSLEGVELFENLNDLYCYDNPLTELDARKNMQLTKIDCHNACLTKLDVPASVSVLYCQGNALTQLDVSKNEHLCELYCECNRLKDNLDVSHCEVLEDLFCYGNELTSVTVSSAWCIVEDPEVEVSGVKENYPIYIALQINEENFPDEAFRNVISNYIYKYRISGYLTMTVAEDGYILPFEVEEIDVKGYSLKNLEGLEHFPNIRMLDCSENELTELDVSGFAKLTELHCNGNQITELDVSGNPLLETLWVDKKVTVTGAGSDVEIVRY